MSCLTRILTAIVFLFRRKVEPSGWAADPSRRRDHSYGDWMDEYK